MPDTTFSVSEMIEHLVPEALVFLHPIFSGGSTPRSQDIDTDGAECPGQEQQDDMRLSVPGRSAVMAISDEELDDAGLVSSEAIEADFDDSASVASIVSDPFSSASIEKEALHLLDTIRSNARTNEDSHGSKILLAGYGFGGIVVKQVHYRQGLPNKLPNLLSDCLLRP